MLNGSNFIDFWYNNMFIKKFLKIRPKIVCKPMRYPYESPNRKVCVSYKFCLCKLGVLEMVTFKVAHGLVSSIEKQNGISCSRTDISRRTTSLLRKPFSLLSRTIGFSSIPVLNELHLVSSGSKSHLISGGDSSYSWVFICALGLWGGRSC